MRTLTSWLRCFAVAGLAALTSCTYAGDSENPVVRSLTWFSYIGGEDIRASCQASAPDRYRFVYNGHYALQIRAYELAPAGADAELTVRARGRSGNIGRLSFDEPFGPWTLDHGTARLSNSQAAAIVTALSDAVATAPPAAGQSMQSYEFYWVVTACSAGKFRLYVFRWPELEVDDLPFVPLLLAHDRSGVSFQKTRQIEGMKEYSFGIAINARGDGLVGR